MASDKECDKRVLVLAPTVKDAGITSRVLQRAGCAVTACKDMGDLCRAILSGAGAVVLTDESLKTEGPLAALRAAMDRQPKWSDLPLVLLAGGGADSSVAAAALHALHNVLVLDRPVHLPTLVSAVKTALRSRERQYEIRDHLDQRKRAEERVKAALEAVELERRRLAAVLEALPAGVAIADQTGKVTHFNASLVRIWGEPPIPQSADDYREWRAYWADTGEPLAAGDWAMARALRTGEMVPGDVVEIEKFDGSGRATIINAAAPIRDAEGRVVAAVVAEIDITAQKQAEKALRESDRRKDEFLAMLGHELRNPLAAITTGLRLLRSPNAERHEWVKESLEGQTKQLVGLVDDLLDISRITRGKIQLRTEIVDLRPIARSAAESTADLIADKKHAFAISASEMPLRVLGDPMRLQQIIANLLNNAAKYTHDGGRIELALGRVEDEAVIRVRDNGMGIPADMQESIFELFGQVDSAMHRPQQGLGIGLNLVKMLVELHGGRVGIASDGMGKGSEFTVRLPVVEGAEDLEDGGGSDERADEELLDVLVVEDFRVTAQMLVAVLQEKGHTVRLAENGRRAIELAAKRQPNLVILDIGLPDISGYQVAEALRQELGYEETLIIATTGYGQEKDRQRSRQAGVDHHLVKPVEYETLALLAREWRRTARDPRLPVSPGRSASTALIGAGRRARILIIDDTHAIARMTQRLLQEWGHEVEVAFDGPSGIEAAREFRPELILCDLNLPGASGFDVASAVKADPALNGAVIAAVTGCAEDDDKQRTKQAGFDAHLVKPVSMGQLQALIRTVVVQNPGDDRAKQ